MGTPEWIKRQLRESIGAQQDTGAQSDTYIIEIIEQPKPQIEWGFQLICKNCNQELSEDWAYCPWCGSKDQVRKYYE